MNLNKIAQLTYDTSTSKDRWSSILSALNSTLVEGFFWILIIFGVIIQKRKSPNFSNYSE